MNCMKKAACSLLLALMAGLAGTASAGVVSLDFEVAPGPDGKVGTADDIPMLDFGWVRDEYASMGVIFTQGTVAKDSYFDGNPNNHFVTSTNPIGFFTRQVFGIKIDSYSMWNATLSVFDINGNLLASDRIENDTGSFVRDVLQVTSATAIHSFSILPDQANLILNLDNMILTVPDPATAVPEPGALALMLGGIGLLGFARRKHTAS